MHFFIECTFAQKQLVHIRNYTRTAIVRHLNMNEKSLYKQFE